MTAGDRSQNYQLAFTEPFLFDRNITGGFDIYKRSLQYIGYYTQKSTGGNLMFGFPVADFSRMFFNYSYETVRIADLNEALIDQSCLRAADGLLDHLVARRPVAADADAGRGPAPQSVRLRLAAARPGRRRGRSARSCRASSTTRWTTRSSRTPGKRLDGVDRPGGARRQHAVLQAARRRHLVQPAHQPHLVRLPRRRSSTSRRCGDDRRRCRSSSGCSSAASTACAASTSARSARRCPARRRARRQQEPALQRRVHDLDCQPGAHRRVLRRRPGARLRRALRVEGGSDRGRSPIVPAAGRSARDVAA